MLTILTNDDGIDAPGLAALRLAIPTDTLVVAPRDAMSECSHQVTTRHPLNITSRASDAYAVAGSPADCTRVALLHLLPQRGLPLDPARVRVLSGINSGGNLGADVYISGTVAAVREAALFGIPAIAFSHYRKGDIADWSHTTSWVHRVLHEIALRPLEIGTYWNVNFPCLTPANPEPRILFCKRSHHPLPVKYDFAADQLTYTQGRYHLRTYEPGSDIDVCFGGNISVSLLRL